MSESASLAFKPHTESNSRFCRFTSQACPASDTPPQLPSHTTVTSPQCDGNSPLVAPPLSSLAPQLLWAGARVLSLKENLS